MWRVDPFATREIFNENIANLATKYTPYSNENKQKKYDEQISSNVLISG